MQTLGKSHLNDEINIYRYHILFAAALISTLSCLKYIFSIKRINLFQCCYFEICWWGKNKRDSAGHSCPVAFYIVFPWRRSGATDGAAHWNQRWLACDDFCWEEPVFFRNLKKYRKRLNRRRIVMAVWSGRVPEERWERSPECQAPWGSC